MIFKKVYYGYITVYPVLLIGTTMNSTGELILVEFESFDSGMKKSIKIRAFDCFCMQMEKKYTWPKLACDKGIKRTEGQSPAALIIMLQ